MNKIVFIYFCYFMSSFYAYCDIPTNLLKTGWIESKGGFIRTGISQQGASEFIIDCVLDVKKLSHYPNRLMGFLPDCFGITSGNSFYINTASNIKAQTDKTYHLRMIQDVTTKTLEIYEFNENFEDEILLERIQTVSNGRGSSECQIFTIKSDSGYVCYGMRVRLFKITIDNELKANFIPVFDTNEGKPGMYDTVRETLLFGTGSFACEDQEIYYGSGNTKIYCDEGTMYFPSYTDFGNLNDFGFPSGTILRGTEEATLTVGSDELNMHTLFGSNMFAGTRYKIGVEYPFGLVTNFFIAKSSNLPALHINLDNKDINYLHSSKNNSAAGSAIKIKPDGSSTKILPVKKLQGRGNASWSGSGNKKSYKINLNDKFSLIDSAGKNKKYALLSVNVDSCDHSGLKEYIAHELADSLDMNFNPAIEFVDLYINGSYRGFYVMKERVTIDASRININEPKYDVEDEESTTRIVQKNGIKGVDGDEGDPDDHGSYRSNWNIPDATETIRSQNDDDDPALKSGIQAYQFATNSQLKDKKEGGFVVEMNVNYDQYCRDEHIFFITRRGQIFSMKIPEVATQEQVQRIAIYMQEFEDALFDTHGINSKGKHYSEYIDVNSYAKHLMIDGFMVNSDFCLLSTFFYINADPITGDFTSKLISEPIWDYDYSFLSSSHVYFNVGYEMIYIQQFFNKADFIKALYELQTNQTGFNAKVSELNSGSLLNFSNQLETSHKLNNYRWGNDSIADATSVKNKMKTRQNSWNNIWSQSTKLLGAWVELNMNRSANPSLSVETYGTATSYQWYKQESDSNELILLEDEDSSTIDPMLHGKGQYICGVYGRNVETQAGGNYITMYTQPYDFTLPEPEICFIVFLTVLLRNKRCII